MNNIIKKIKLNIRKIQKEVMQHMILPAVYRFSKGDIDDRIVVLADCHHEKCPEDMRLIRELLVKNNYKVVDYFFDIANISAVENLKRMMNFMRVYKRAGTVIICSYFLPVASCKKHKGTTVINMWHGCGAMKKFGYDSDEDIPKGYRGNPFANTDYMCVSGMACVEPFKSATNYPKTQVVPWGSSITDIYFKESYIRKCKEKFWTEYPDAKGKRVVVWAPTFRENALCAKCVGEEHIDDLIQDNEVSAKYYIIKSLHPNVKGVEHKLTTRELMICSDVLITDYSSVWFEYLLLKKPIIFFAPDYSRYMKNRGLYLDYNSLPGIIIKDKFSNIILKETLLQNKYDNEDYKLQRRYFSDIYMGGCDGMATKRLLEKING